MRSRYAAFALGLGAYLVDTLAAAHPDRSLAREPLVRELSRARIVQRFTGLRILFSAMGGPSGEDPERGQVLFLAGVFVDGRDRSFLELSDFVRESGGWRYAGGVLAAPRLFADELQSLTPATFVARIAATGP
jgi:SEC-C motif domain protein